MVSIEWQFHLFGLWSLPVEDGGQLFAVENLSCLELASIFVLKSGSNTRASEYQRQCRLGLIGILRLFLHAGPSLFDCGLARARSAVDGVGGNGWVVSHSVRAVLVASIPALLHHAASSP